MHSHYQHQRAPPGSCLAASIPDSSLSNVSISVTHIVTQLFLGTWQEDLFVGQNLENIVCIKYWYIENTR